MLRGPIAVASCMTSAVQCDTWKAKGEALKALSSRLRSCRRHDDDLTTMGACSWICMLLSVSA